MSIRHLSLLLVLLVCLSSFHSNDHAPFIKTADGIIIYPSLPSKGILVVKLQVIADNIIRVIASPEKELPKRSSLIINDPLPAAPKFESGTNKDIAFIKTASLSAQVNLKTGVGSILMQKAKRR